MSQGMTKPTKWQVCPGKIQISLLALVAQSDGRLTEDQEVPGSTPAGSATFFHGD